MKKPLEILERYWGHSNFRPNQLEIIEAVLQNKDCLALLPTGGGKSICFQIPALIKKGICIVISPLIALMKDQVSNLNNKGIKALALTNIDRVSELDRMLDNCIYGNYKFLYISPERLKNKLIQERIKLMNVSFIAVDEAHCISAWGHDFRPAYGNIKKIRTLCPHSALIALTATATNQVIKDIFLKLDFISPKLFKNSFYRPNLSYHCIGWEDAHYKTISLLKKFKGSAIVYVGSRLATEQIAKMLEAEGVSSGYYHGGLDLRDKDQMYKSWMNGQFRVMIATNAFGMGIDKSEVETVIHLSIPESLEAYFQESGRAGRNGKKARAFLITGPDTVVNTKRWFISQIPDVAFLKLIYKKLCIFFQIAYGELVESRFGLDFDAFCQLYKLPKKKTYNALKVLEHYGILVFETLSKRITKLEFLISSSALQNHIKKRKKTNTIIKIILRSYEGIFDQYTAIDIEKIALKAGVKATDVLEVLQVLKSEAVLEFTSLQTDAQITFLLPREDEKTINAISKPVTTQNAVKVKKLNAVISYIENNKLCKSQQLLEYFEEKNSEPCGSCNVCNQILPPKCRYNKQEIALVFNTLKKSSLSSRELVDICNLEDAAVVKILRYLLEQNKIKLTKSNQYQLL